MLHDILSHPSNKEFTHPSFSGLFVICAYFPHTTFPPGVTKPRELTSTSIIVYNQYILLDGEYPSSQHTKLSIHRTAGILLNADDWTLDGNSQLPMGNISFLHPQSHRPNESFHLRSASTPKDVPERRRYFNRPSCKPFSYKSRFRNNPLPTLPLTFSRLQNLENLLLSHPSNFG
jgi:hypothetical protein